MQAVLALREFSIRVVPFWKSREEEVIKWADFGSRDCHSDDIAVDWGTLKLVGLFLLIALLQVAIPSVQGSSLGYSPLVLLVWTSSCRS